MAKNGFKLLDSDMHIVEPPDLWERFIDPAFRARAPRGWPGPENPSVLEVAGKVMPRIAATPQAHYQTMYARKADRYRHAIARNYDPVSQLEAMDIEGIDVAVLFPTRGLYALATDDLEPDLAAAIARAYNDWLADFCAPAPSRLIGAAMVAPHHVDAAVAETRRTAACWPGSPGYAWAFWRATAPGCPSSSGASTSTTSGAGSGMRPTSR